MQVQSDRSFAQDRSAPLTFAARLPLATTTDVNPRYSATIGPTRLLDGLSLRATSLPPTSVRRFAFAHVQLVPDSFACSQRRIPAPASGWYTERRRPRCPTINTDFASRSNGFFQHFRMGI